MDPFIGQTDVFPEKWGVIPAIAMLGKPVGGSFQGPDLDLPKRRRPEMSKMSYRADQIQGDWTTFTIRQVWEIGEKTTVGQNEYVMKIQYLEDSFFLERGIFGIFSGNFVSSREFLEVVTSGLG